MPSSFLLFGRNEAKSKLTVRTVSEAFFYAGAMSILNVTHFVPPHSRGTTGCAEDISALSKPHISRITSDPMRIVVKSALNIILTNKFVYLFTDSHVFRVGIFALYRVVL